MNSILEGGILVLGGGGHCKSVVGGLLASGLHVAGVLADSPQSWGKEIQGVSILGPFSDLVRYPNCSAVIALGDNADRRLVAERFPDAHWASVCYPQVYINPTARIGAGTVVLSGAAVGPDVIIGTHAIVSANTSVGHDTILEDYAHLAPAAQVGGGARVGRGAMLGMGSIVCPKIKIGEWAVLGAGAVAVTDIPARCRAFGIPARTREAKPASA
jgi:acetyltransferase EpsM